jgi:gamma-glutamyltranspeptidase/glutathione hydrolase
MLGLEQGMSPEQIAAMPRYHHQYLPDTIVAEPGAFSPETVAALEAMGHTVQVGDKPWTFFLHAVDWNLRDGSMRGGADPRNPTGKASVSPAPARAKATAEARP